MVVDVEMGFEGRTFVHRVRLQHQRPGDRLFGLMSRSPTALAISDSPVFGDDAAFTPFFCRRNFPIIMDCPVGLHAHRGGIPPPRITSPIIFIALGLIKPRFWRRGG